MIKLKDILLESTAPNIFVPRRIEGRVERLISLYVRNGSKGDLDLDYLKLTVLPDMLKDITVGGDFLCRYNKLTSLINVPKSVGEDFDCSVNKLTSLINAPSSVGGYFDCSVNSLTSLEGAPKTVGGDFICYNNKLKSLTGAPKFVGGEFSCHTNPGKFTEQDVRAVCDVKGKVYV